MQKLHDVTTDAFDLLCLMKGLLVASRLYSIAEHQSLGNYTFQLLIINFIRRISGWEVIYGNL